MESHNRFKSTNADCLLSSAAVLQCAKDFIAMISVTEIFLTILLAIFLQFLYKWFKRPDNFPPGPPHLPIIGSIPFLKGNGLEKLVGQEIASYGPITGFFVGAYPTVVINDWKLAKSLFAREDFSGRLRY